MPRDSEKENMHIRLVGLNARFTHSCLALFCVRNELEKYCSLAEVVIFQGTVNDGYYETLLRVTEGGPDALFFSAAIWNSELVRRLVGDCRRLLPQVVLVVGGPQAGEIAAGLPAGCCTIVRGEIEAVGQGFYDDLLQGRLQPLYAGSFLRLPHRSLAFPYRDEDFVRHLRHRHIYYESSRGCPFSCSYCLSAAERGVWHKDLDQVCAELGEILRHRPRVVRFVDRTFNDNPDRALAIWEFLVPRGGETLFHFEIAPDRFNEETFDFLAQVPPGMFQFEIGIQSTNDDTLAAIDRRIDPLQARELVRRLAAAANIHLHVDLILGLPHETGEAFLKSFADVFAMEAHYIQMGLLKLLPDTPIRHEAEAHSYLFCAEPPYSVLANRWLTHGELADLYWFCECVEKFHNNRFFVSLWRYLRHSDEDIAGFFQGLLAVCREHGFFGLAATQELMCSLLSRHCAGRTDEGLISDLLRYDWLRCGHRLLPPFLALEAGRESPGATKDRLYQTMPAEHGGVYGRGEKNHFFRKAVFLRLSSEAAGMLGLAVSGDGIDLCFSAERDDSLFRFNRVVDC
nr:Mg\-protoporphyrin IX monomethyl ester oxidative cyclase [uncultured bacterium]